MIPKLKLLVPLSLVVLLLTGLNAFAESTRPPASRVRVQSKFSLNDPHRPSSKGPWFEGWYYRLSDKDGRRSIAVIVATSLSAENPLRRMADLPGYVAVLISEGDGSPTKSFEAFPAQSTIRSRGEVEYSTHDFDPKSDFEWSAPGFGRLTESTVDITIPGAVSLKAEFGEPLAWNQATHLIGPEGMSAYAPFIPLHWHVNSLGSDSRYQLLYDDPENGSMTVEGEAYVHQEKNWGAAFPTAWMWAQGVTPGNEAQVALAGGRLKLAGVELTTFLVGFRSPKARVDFRPSDPTTRFFKTIDPCAGTFELRAVSAKNELIIRAHADLKTFAPVSIPTPTGYEANGGKESFSATIEVGLYKNGLLPQLGLKEMVDRRVFQNAALEFGADYQVCTGFPIF